MRAGRGWVWLVCVSASAMGGELPQPSPLGLLMCAVLSRPPAQPTLTLLMLAPERGAAVEQELLCATRVLGPAPSPWTTRPALWVASDRSPDRNAEQVRILRCALNITERALALPRARLHVRLLGASAALASFRVPLHARMTGVFELPSHYPHYPSPPLRTPGPSVHLALAGLELSLGGEWLVLESVLHHLGAGVGRVLLSTAHAFASTQGRALLSALSTPIAQGKLLVFSYARLAASPLMLQVPGYSRGRFSTRDTLNLLFDNAALYLTHGEASHLAVWDLDELLVPHLALGPLLAELTTLHPLHCALVLSSAALFREHAQGRWVGHAFNGSAARSADALGLNYVKSIHAVQRVQHIGLHLPGACAPLNLDPAERCVSVDAAQAELFHAQVHRPKMRRPRPSNGSNEYSARFFPAILGELNMIRNAAGD